MSRQYSEICWIAALLEGEGCFSVQKRGYYPMIMLGMTDLDVVQRARNIMNPSTRIVTHEPKKKSSFGTKEYHNFTLTGSIAVQWMMTIYPLMGNRRKERIRELLIGWKSQVNSGMHDPERIKDNRQNRVIKSIMRSRNVSREEAKIILEKIMYPDDEVTNVQ